MTTGLSVTTKNVPITTGQNNSPNWLNVSSVPSAIKKTITKKSRSGLSREAISGAYGREARKIPEANAPISIEKPALASSAALPRPQAIAAKKSNS